RQAPADRHRLFRDLQPTQRHAGRSARRTDRADQPTGICTTEAEYPVDIIVFATGFDAMTGPMLRMNIRGRGGVPLKDVWEAGPLTYLGLQIAGFPNLFTITGPGSPSVLCNMPVAIEQHADWITDCIDHLRAKGLQRIEARADAVD